MNRIIIRAAAAVASGTLLALALPLAASAHVTVNPNAAEPGSFSLVSFRVPNESADAVTTSVTVTLPLDTPLAYVSYVPVPGWTTELVTTKLDTPVEGEYGTITEAVSSVTWTAEPGSEIAAGQLQLFPLSVGPVPDTGSIALPTDQTYSDGTVVSWSEIGDDVEHPAPVLYINDAPQLDHHDGDAGVEVAAAETGSHDGVARGLGIAGLVLGTIGLVVAITGRRKSEARS